MSRKIYSINKEVLPGILLILFSGLALLIANTDLNEYYHNVLHEINLFNDFTIHMFINDFLMAIFFFVVGLEIKKEVLHGSLSEFKKASFPVIAALGGVIIPAVMFIMINKDSKFLRGVGIPISTDIAFALGIFMLLKHKLNPSLKVFLLSLAVVDDLISILVIGVLYSSDINITAVIASSAILIALLLINKVLKIRSKSIYVIGGVVLWYFIYKSNVHATISGVLLAIVVPATGEEGRNSLMEQFEHLLSPFTNFIILPLFAFANTAIVLSSNVNFGDTRLLSMGIILALVIGKPLGILLFTYIATKLSITEKPQGIGWVCIFNVGIIAGIGFTMSIFVSEIAFNTNIQLMDIAKISVLISSAIAIALVFIVTNLLYNPKSRLHKFACSVSGVC